MWGARPEPDGAVERGKHDERGLARLVVDADEVGDTLGVSGERRLFPQQRVVGVDVDGALDAERSQGPDGVGRSKDAERDVVCGQRIGAAVAVPLVGGALRDRRCSVAL